MSSAFPSSFEDADPDPPDSELSAETQLVMANCPAAFTVSASAAIANAFSGDFTSLNEIRRLFDLSSPPHHIPFTEDSISGIRIFRFTPSAQPHLPLVLFMHGGAWAHRLFEATSVLCSELASALPAEVIAVDYSLSPEAPPGTALRECQTVFEALSPGRFVVVGGDSAGGNMAACLVFRIRAGNPNARLPDAVFALYPMVDFLDRTSFAYKRYSRGYGLAHDEIMTYSKAYCPDESKWRLPVFSPLYGEMDAFPPTLVITTQFDALRDQGRAFAKKIEQAGRPVRYKCIKGTIHGCACREGFDKARAEIVAEVKRFYDLLK